MKTILARYPMGEGCQAVVWSVGGAYQVKVFDTEAGESLPTVMRFSNGASALDCAEKLSQRSLGFRGQVRP